MKKFFFVFLIFQFLSGCQAQRKTDNLSKTSVLTIYSADNFISEKIWDHTIPVFETKFDCKTENNSNSTGGIKLLLKKCRNEFRLTDSTAFYADEDYKSIERKIVKF